MNEGNEKMLPQLDMEETDAWWRENNISARVLVKIDHSDILWFARYNHHSQRWMVDGCVGDIVVTEWWEIPKTPGHKI